jgi:hypothetical protein
MRTTFSMVRSCRSTSCGLLTAFAEAGGETGVQEVRNKQALLVYNRVQHKLTGEYNCANCVLLIA